MFMHDTFFLFLHLRGRPTGLLADLRGHPTGLLAGRLTGRDPSGE